MNGPGFGDVTAEIAEPVRALLGPEATAVTVGDNTLEFWWVKALPLQGPPAGAPEWKNVAPGSLVGALRVASGDETIELRERHEEAVVGKTARVVEEVEIGKQSRQRTETIEDTILRQDVDIEGLEPTTPRPPDQGSSRKGQGAPRGR